MKRFRLLVTMTVTMLLLFSFVASAGAAGQSRGKLTFQGQKSVMTPYATFPYMFTVALTITKGTREGAIIRVTNTDTGQVVCQAPPQFLFCYQDLPRGENHFLAEEITGNVQANPITPTVTVVGFP